MRYAQHFYLKDIAFKDEYIRRHDELWPEMKQLLCDSGFRSYTIWISGINLFAYFENDDLELAYRVLNNSPVKAKWDSYMDDIITWDGSNESLECAFNFD